MLQAVVAEDQARAELPEQARAGEPVGGHDRRTVAAAREQQRLIAHRGSSAWPTLRGACLWRP